MQNWENLLNRNPMSRLIIINKVNLLLIIIGLLLPVLLLFKAYPSEIPCGKIVQITSHIAVPVNCDSSLFFKDADNPKRLVDGSSIYSDRPLPSAAVYVVDIALKAIGLPDKRVKIQGTSGSIYEYSQRKYVLFILMNFVILLLALTLAAKGLELSPILQESKINRLILLNAIFLVSTNEVVKTFIWTPHVQMFNILLPCFVFWEISKFNSHIIRGAKITFLVMCVTLGIFSYPLFVLGLLPLLFYKYKKLSNRLLIVLASVSSFVLYPKIVVFFGGSFTNQQATKFREFVWFLDVCSGKSPPSLIGHKLVELIKSFPIIPSLLILLVSVLLLLVNKKEIVVDSIQRFEFLFAILYILFIFGIGLGERRLALGVVIFGGLSVFKMLSQTNLAKFKPFVLFSLSLLAIFQVFSFLFTLGPLK